MRKAKIVDVPETRMRLRNIISEYDSLIVDTHIPEGIVPDHSTRIVFVLRCNPQILEFRLRRRKWTSKKIEENVLAEILDSCLIAAHTKFGKRKVVQLDTSHASVKRSVSVARKILLNSKQTKSSVNWLGMLEKDGSFARYLR